MSRPTLRASLFALGLLACGSDEGPAKTPPPTGAPSPTAAAPTAPRSSAKVGPGRIVIPGLGISVEVARPVGIIGTAAMGKPGASLTVGDDMVYLTRGAGATMTLEANKAELRAARHPFQEITKESVTEGGWHLEYLALGSADKNKLRGVEVHATVAGTPVHCRALTRFGANAPALTAICDSMLAAP